MEELWPPTYGAWLERKLILFDFVMTVFRPRSILRIIFLLSSFTVLYAVVSKFMLTVIDF